jgi:phosphorylcholine metabolism protein LicD
MFFSSFDKFGHFTARPFDKLQSIGNSYSPNSTRKEKLSMAIEWFDKAYNRKKLREIRKNKAQAKNMAQKQKNMAIYVDDYTPADLKA